MDPSWTASRGTYIRLTSYIITSHSYINIFKIYIVIVYRHSNYLHLVIVYSHSNHLQYFNVFLKLQHQIVRLLFKGLHWKQMPLTSTNAFRIHPPPSPPQLLEEDGTQIRHRPQAGSSVECAVSEDGTRLRTPRGIWCRCCRCWEPPNLSSVIFLETDSFVRWILLQVWKRGIGEPCFESSLTVWIFVET